MHNPLDIGITNVIKWVKEQEKDILAKGTSLDPQGIKDAKKIGIQKFDKIRLLYVDKIPTPKESIIIEAARKQGLSLEEASGITLGYGILILKERKDDRHLLLHELVHVLQIERMGLISFLIRYIYDCISRGYANSQFELEADRVADSLLYEKVT